jgi:hypothetical protein
VGCFLKSLSFHRAFARNCGGCDQPSRHDLIIAHQA